MSELHMNQASMKGPHPSVFDHMYDIGRYIIGATVGFGFVPLLYMGYMAAFG
jgi:hypothetical protein